MCIRDRDNDQNTRKFACFAIGNAGFHSDKLYENLRPVIPSLVELLKDPEEKTRANAAGALGNFARNSKALTNDLIKYGALHSLLSVAQNEKGQNDSSQRISLFSIGNLCIYPECRKLFEELKIRSILESFQSSKDQLVLRYANRIIQKLDQYSKQQ
eukprot:TRINITY_DN7037_c0_g1_i1.p1 TRINITY_DN7037_c0_g1~~TRINITY_DN7037_c0_g1_i1.p1  ORF type:complete len:157 (+),score=24.10 TRINITY_DN7037_c0_g1_i1:135-605(+)